MLSREQLEALAAEMESSHIERKASMSDKSKIEAAICAFANRAHIRVATRLTDDPVEARSPDYPLPATQQLLRNAVMHRNYETSNAPVHWYWFTDRIEVHNPGGLYGRVTPQSFGQPGGNDYRNPTIAAALHQLGFVQRFGMGIPLARKACADNGNPPPEFNFQPSSFAVIVKARR